MLIDDTKVDCDTARSFPAVCGGFGVKVTVLVPDDEDDEDSFREDGDMVIGPFATRDHADKVVARIRKGDQQVARDEDDEEEGEDTEGTYPEPGDDDWEEESITSARLIAQTRPFPRGLHDASVVVGAV